MSNNKTTGETKAAKAAKASLYVREVLQQYRLFLQTSKLNPLLYQMDIDTLRVVVKRYLDDIERIHHYHDIDLVDSHKIAGYLTYWVCRLKPIRVVDKRAAYQNNINDDTVRKVANKSFFINELFALFLGLSRIDTHYRKEQINRTVVVNKDFINSFTYSLKYRFITGDMLSLMYGMIDNSCAPAR